MEPVAALSREARVDQFGVEEDSRGRERTASPERWTRRMLDALIVEYNSLLNFVALLDVERLADACQGFGTECPILGSLLY